MLRYSPVNMLQEGEKPLVAVVLLALRQHFPRPCIQCSKQRRRTVTAIIMGHTFPIAQSQRWHRLSSLQCLDLYGAYIRKYPRKKAARFAFLVGLTDLILN